MNMRCNHWRDCGVTGGGCCAINAYERPSRGVCLRICDQYDGPDRAPLIAQLEARLTISAQRRSQRITPGQLVRRAIHFALDSIDAFIRPRDRCKLWILDRIKKCGICKEREILIDCYTLHVWNRLRRSFAKEAT